MNSNEPLEQAIEQLSSLDYVWFNTRFLVEDVACVYAAFPEKLEFEAAIVSTMRVLKLIAAGRVDASVLKDDYEGWKSCHYQHRVGQGIKADMRIMYQLIDGVVRVRGFGERRAPADFYWRMAGASRAALLDATEGEDGGQSDSYEQ